MISQRIVWIDFIKGVLLSLICISHLSKFPNWVIPYLRPTPMYYVPFFFILSGFLFSGKMSFGQYIHRKVKTLLIPYVFFSLLFIVIDWDTYLSHSCLSNSLYRAFVVGVSVPRSSPLWFVLLLFTTSIAGCYILKCCDNRFLVYLSLGGGNFFKFMCMVIIGLFHPIAFAYTFASFGDLLLVKWVSYCKATLLQTCKFKICYVCGCLSYDMLFKVRYRGYAFQYHQ